MTGSAFAAALLDPALPAPSGLVGPQGAPAGRRFSVYRNNVAVGLKDALAASFPVLRKLLGDEFFAAMSGIFLRDHPPSSPLMMFYGEAMPGFLAAFPAVAHLGYLPDVARLELAIRQSYHAADADPITPETLAGTAPEALMNLRPALAPALRLIRSDWPVLSIWLANTSDTPAPKERRAEDVVVLRPEFDPVPHALPPGAAEFVAALQGGASFADATAVAPDGFDLGATVTLLMSGGAITGFHPEP
jgi:Putative DNA-binding domain